MLFTKVKTHLDSKTSKNQEA